MRHSVRKFLMAAAIASVSFAGAASAADMRMPVKALPPPVPVLSWTGCYIGGNVGGVWDRTSQTQIAKVTGVAVGPNDFGSSNGSGFTGGAQVGCDYQFASRWVVGVQGMFDFSNFSDQHTLPAFPAFFDVDNLKDVFTVTGRVGYLFTPALLGYVKGGGAWARADYNIFGFGPPLFASESATGINRQGWTVGAGLEWMFVRNWSVFGEFNYMDFGNKDIGFVQAPGTVGVADVVRTRLQVEQFLVGVNYRFNFGGPVAARY